MFFAIQVDAWKGVVGVVGVGVGGDDGGVGGDGVVDGDDDVG